MASSDLKTLIESLAKFGESAKASSLSLGSSGFADAVKLLTEMPGYSSRDDRNGDKLCGAEITKIWIDELAHEKKEGNVMKSSWRLAVLVATINEYLEVNHPEVVMLAGPASLTVQRKAGVWSKEPHIGGEEFVAKSVYLGKRGEIIVALAPQEPASYDVMEMPMTVARKSLSGFSVVMDRACGGDLDGELIKVSRAKSEEKDAKAGVNKSKQYAAEGWGDW